MSLAISLWLICLDFLINQPNYSKNGLQPQLIRRKGALKTYLSTTYSFFIDAES